MIEIDGSKCPWDAETQMYLAKAKDIDIDLFEPPSPIYVTLANARLKLNLVVHDPRQQVALYRCLDISPGEYQGNIPMYQYYLKVTR